MLEVRNLTKKFGDITAVDGISFTVQPGVVTGFLGPNGAGKTTTMSMILGLDKPTSGVALVNGASYVSSPAPLAQLGALLDAKSVDKGRSARNHLRALGATVGVGKARVDELLEVVGLTDVAGKSAGEFSLGMGQRLGIASALIADPSVVMLDEPVNGLDPDGILWIRNLLKELAREGRTVFLSSHLMSEMELTAEHLIVIGKGHIIADLSMAEFIGRATTRAVSVTTPDTAELVTLLSRPGVTVDQADSDEVEVSGMSAAEIGDAVAGTRIRLHRLYQPEPSLEEAFMELTAESVEFHGSVSTHGKVHGDV